MHVIVRVKIPLSSFVILCVVTIHANSDILCVLTESVQMESPLEALACKEGLSVVSYHTMYYCTDYRNVTNKMWNRRG